MAALVQLAWVTRDKPSGSYFGPYQRGVYIQIVLVEVRQWSPPFQVTLCGLSRVLYVEYLWRLGHWIRFDRSSFQCVHVQPDDDWACQLMTSAMSANRSRVRAGRWLHNPIQCMLLLSVYITHRLKPHSHRIADHRIRNQQISLNSLGTTPSPGVDENNFYNVHKYASPHLSFC